MSIGSSLVLGTAQFGMPYGVANRTGQLDVARAAATIRVAKQHGIQLLDTAVSYGQSEELLGQMDLGELQVMTKLPEVPPDCAEVRAWVCEQVAGSIRRLGVPSLHALSFHRPQQLLEAYGHDLYAEVQSLKDRGLVEKIGISIYRPAELESLLQGRSFDIVQAPFNIFDRRILLSGWLDRLNDIGCEVHARSIFLQGLLLLPAGRRPVYFRRWEVLFAGWDAWLRDVGLSPIEASLRYALSVPGIAKLVIGVDDSEQLEQIFAAAPGYLPPVSESLSCADPELLEPSNWP